MYFILGFTLFLFFFTIGVDSDVFSRYEKKPKSVLLGSLTPRRTKNKKIIRKTNSTSKNRESIIRIFQLLFHWLFAPFNLRYHANTLLCLCGVAIDLLPFDFCEQPS